MNTFGAIKSSLSQLRLDPADATKIQYADPNYTEVQRDLLTPRIGDRIWNSTVSRPQFYTGATNLWRSNHDMVSVVDYGAVGDGTNDDAVAVNDILSEIGAGVTIFIPRGNWKFKRPVVVNNLDNVHIVLAPGARITCTDGAWTLLDIDSSIVGMPTMKCVFAFLDSDDCSISGGEIDASGLTFNAACGESGIFIRTCQRVDVDGCYVKNVWPSALSSPGGSGVLRYTGILVVRSKSCTIARNRVTHCNYDGIGARMRNEDIKIIGNRCWDNWEGIQSSDRYGTVNPLESNVRTVIEGNECFANLAENIVWHSTDVICRGNVIHNMVVGTRGIRVIGSRRNTVVGNYVYGTLGNVATNVTDFVAPTSAEITTADNTAFYLSDSGQSVYAHNYVRYCNRAFWDQATLANSTIANNIVISCNYGYDTLATQTRTRINIFTGNNIGAFICGLRLQDDFTRIACNQIYEVSDAGVAASIGMDLDPNGNNDTSYTIESSMPSGFNTSIANGTSLQDYFAPSNITSADRYYNKGTVTITTGNTSGTDGLSLDRTPTAGEVQVTQLTGPIVAFRAAWTSSTLTIFIASAQASNCTFGWRAEASQFEQ